jgi:hypothetical protein
MANSLINNGIDARSIIDEGVIEWDEIGKFDTKWTISDDPTVQGAPGASGYTYLPFECQSPPLVFCQSSLVHVEKVVGVLCNNYRLIANETCGLHCQYVYLSFIKPQTLHSQALLITY